MHHRLQVVFGGTKALIALGRSERFRAWAQRALQRAINLLMSQQLLPVIAQLVLSCPAGPVLLLRRSYQQSSPVAWEASRGLEEGSFIYGLINNGCHSIIETHTIIFEVFESMWHTESICCPGRFFDKLNTSEPKRLSNSNFFESQFRVVYCFF